jgi:predicted membrane protein
MRFGPFLGLAVLLAILWASSFLVFHVVGFFIHILLILAVISLLVHLRYNAVRARMAELADALRSGRSSRKGVEVRVLFRAPNRQRSFSTI